MKAKTSSSLYTKNCLPRQVNVLGLGVRDLVPATPDGGPLQAPLQHVRVSSRLHRGAAGAAVGRGENVGPACTDTLSRL